MSKQLVRRVLGISTIVALLALSRAIPAANEAPAADERTITVAADGSGQYRTVQEAIDAVAAGGKDQVTIRIKPGTYKQHLEIPKNKSRIRFVGEDAAKTVLTWDLHAKSVDANNRPVGTMNSSSTVLRGSDFTAENVTFADSTPRDIAQALAIAALGDKQVFRRCRFLGWQDTVYTGEGRQYFEDCYIEGGVDFIFGPGTSVFKNCEIRSIRKGYVTAASTPKTTAFGYVFLNCRLTASDDLPPNSVHLGRPWRDFASVVYINCELGPHIRPEGWDNWREPAKEKTSRYSEFGSTGRGAAPDKRVAWAKQLTEAEAKAITVQAVLRGKDNWDPATPADRK